jgi:hypothetical protein
MQDITAADIEPGDVVLGDDGWAFQYLNGTTNPATSLAGFYCPSVNTPTPVAATAHLRLLARGGQPV